MRTPPSPLRALLQHPLRFVALFAMMIIAGTSGGTVPVPTWVTEFGRAGADAGQYTVTARQLADGTLMIVTKDGGYARATHLDASGDLIGETLLDIPTNSSVVADTDAFGRLAVACVIPVNSAGDTWVMKYDGISGARMWSTPALFASASISTGDRPAAVLFDRLGDIVVVVVADGTSSDESVALKLAGESGARLWGPTTVMVGVASTAVIDSANSIVVGGNNSWSPDCDYVVAKITSSGSRLWGPVSYSSGYEPATLAAIAVDAAGNVFVTGSVPNSSRHDVATLSYSGSNGALRWGPIRFDRHNDAPSSDIDDDYGRAIVVDGAGNPIVIANSNGDIVALKYTAASGALAWGPAVVLADGELDPRVAALDGAGDLLVSGTRTLTNNSDLATVKLSGQDGAVQFGPLFYGGAGADTVRGVVVGTSGEALVYGDVRNDLGTSKAAVVRYDGVTGSLLGSPWTSGPLANVSDMPRDAAADQAGDWIVLLESRSMSTGGEDFVLLKLDHLTGEAKWGPVVLDGGGPDLPTDIEVDLQGNALVAGSTRNASGKYDMVVAKYSGASGALVWGPSIWNGAANGDDYATALAVDASGNVVVTGYSYAGSSTRDNWVTLKLSGTDGSVLWGPFFYNGPTNGHDRARAVRMDTSGDVVVSGTAYVSDGTSNEDVVTIKYAGSNGAVLWGPVFTKGGTRRFEALGALQLNSAGDVFLAVLSKSGTYYDLYDIVVASMSGATGALRWGPTVFDSGGNETPIALAFNAAGDVTVAASGSNAGAVRLLALCYAASNGASLWGPLYSAEAVNPTAAAANLAGDLIVVGSVVDPSENRNDGFTMRIRGTDGGEASFAISIDSQYSDEPSLVRTDGAGFMVAGTVNSGNWYRARLFGFTDNLGIATLPGDLASRGCGLAFSQQLAAANGDGSYTWSLVSGSLPPGVVLTSAGSIEGTPLDEGAFPITVRVADGANAQSERSFELRVFPVPAQGSITAVPEPACQGAEVELTAPDGYPSYLWYPGGYAGRTVHLASSHPFAVGVTMSDGTCTHEASRLVAVIPSTLTPPSVTPSGPTTFCAGDSVTLTSSVATRYAWSTGESTRSIVVTQGGSYSVTAFNTAGCSAVSDPISVQVDAAPSAEIMAPTSVCEGSGDHAAWVPNAGQGATYTWTITNGTITSGSGTTSITFSAGSAGPVSLGVTVTTAAGCAASGLQDVAINPLPVATITAPAAVCATSTGHNASVPDAGVGATYTWTITNGTITGGEGTALITFGAGPVGPITLGVTVTTAAGCTATGSQDVAVNALPVATITAPAAVCATSSAHPASVPDAGSGATYAWTIDNGSITAGAGTPTITFSAGPAGPVALGVTVTTGAGCVATSSSPVAVTPLPSAAITAPAAVCAGSTGHAASVADAGAGAAYAWSIGNGTITAGDGTPSITFTAGSGGPVSLAVTVTSGAGCAASGSQSVAVNALPSAAITAPVGACASSTGNAASVPDAGTGAAYAWAITNGTITGGSGTRAITFTAGASGSVGLSVTVTSGAGCIASGSQAVPVNAPPSATITAASAVCAGSTGNAASVPDAGSGATYTWGITNGTITAGTGTRSISFTAGSTSPVTLTVAVTSGAGCTAAGSKAVTVNAAPNATITAPSSVRRNSSNNAASVPTAGTGATYQWTITNGTITSGLGTRSIKFRAGSVGTLTLRATVTKSTGCQAIGTKTIPVT